MRRKVGGLLVVPDQEILRRQIALGDVVPGVEFDPLLVALNGFADVSRAQVVVERGDVQAVADGLPVSKLEGLADVVGSQRVLVQVVITDGKIGAGKGKPGIEFNRFLQGGNSLERT